MKHIEGETAEVDFGGVSKKISLGILSGVKKGDYVLVHAGFAIGKVDKTEAEDTLKTLQELKEIAGK
ncbi:MAG: HypC/HybG/HupF family hydrogenase formation chaperone [bacterium]